MKVSSIKKRLYKFCYDAWLLPNWNGLIYVGEEKPLSTLKHIRKGQFIFIYPKQEWIELTRKKTVKKDEETYYGIFQLWDFGIALSLGNGRFLYRDDVYAEMTKIDRYEVLTYKDVEGWARYHHVGRIPLYCKNAMKEMKEFLKSEENGCKKD